MLVEMEASLVDTRQISLWGKRTEHCNAAKTIWEYTVNEWTGTEVNSGKLKLNFQGSTQKGIE